MLTLRRRAFSDLYDWPTGGTNRIITSRGEEGRARWCRILRDEAWRPSHISWSGTVGGIPSDRFAAIRGKHSVARADGHLADHTCSLGLYAMLCVIFARCACWVCARKVWLASPCTSSGPACRCIRKCDGEGQLRMIVKVEFC
jgi:hypothetical protein